MDVTAERIRRRRRVEIDGPVERVADEQRLDLSSLGEERREQRDAIADVAMGDDRRVRLRQSPSRGFESSAATTRWQFAQGPARATCPALWFSESAMIVYVGAPG